MVVPELTALRGLAALVVLLVHISVFWPQLAGEGGLAVGALAVDVFFILSGYLLAARTRPYSEFIFARACRTLPTHLVVCTFTCLPIAAVTGAWSTFAATVTMLGVPLGLDSLNGPIWSLGAEWWVYLSWPVVLRFGRLPRLWWVGPVLSVGAIWWAGLRYPWGWPSLARAFGGALLGISLRKSFPTVPSIKYLRHPVLQWFGLISFPLYMVHWFIFSACAALITPWFLGAVIAVVLSLATATLVHHLVELPGLRIHWPVSRTDNN